PQAQYNIGLMTERGQGVTRDRAAAALWYWKAAHRGVAAAQLQLGVAFATGTGVGRDPAEALKWLDLAAKNGQPVPQALRARIAESLTPAERAEAGRTVREFSPIPAAN